MVLVTVNEFETTKTAEFQFTKSYGESQEMKNFLYRFVFLSTIVKFIRFLNNLFQKTVTKK